MPKGFKSRTLPQENHGEWRSSEYSAWLSMKARCYNDKHPNHKYHGGRGISVCERWRYSFVAFLADVGRKPTPAHTLDRWPDNDGNYEPGNVRWATRHEQMQNLRNNHNITALGETLSLSEWARRIGATSSMTIHGRLKNGWPASMAAALPIGSEIVRFD